MYLLFISTIVSIALGGAAVAWYYNRAFLDVRYEYLGSGFVGMAGRIDDTYLMLVGPLRMRRLIAVCVATGAFCLAVLLIGLHTA